MDVINIQAAELTPTLSGVLGKSSVPSMTSFKQFEAYWRRGPVAERLSKPRPRSRSAGLGENVPLGGSNHSVALKPLSTGPSRAQHCGWYWRTGTTASAVI